MSGTLTCAGLRRLRRASIVCLAVCLAGGCGSGDWPTLDSQRLAQYGKLTRVSQTHHADLRAELARIVAERGTPMQLMQPPDAGGGGSSSEAAGRSGWNRRLAEIFPADAVAEAGPRADQLLAGERFRFSASQMKAIIGFRTQREERRRRFRALVRTPGFGFELRHVDGLLADLSFIDAARLGCRLEAMLAAEQLDNALPDEAIESLGVMLRVAHCLAEKKHVATRTAAAHLRADSMRVLEAIAQHPEADKASRQRLFKLLERELDHWPPDVDAWRGDRAQGMHTYELVRDGQLLSVLRPDEIEQFTERGELQAFAATAAETVDEDELFYLKTLRRIMESCNEPYYRARPVYREMRDQIDQRRDTPEFPLIAARILLPNVELGRQVQARDRAICEGWAIALAVATHQARPPYPINPLTGEPYRIEQKATYVAVWGAGPPGGDRPLVVPTAPADASNRPPPENPLQ